MKKEMKIILPVYKIVYAFAFVVILSLIRGVVFTNEIGLSIEGPFAILTAVFVQILMCRKLQATVPKFRGCIR